MIRFIVSKAVSITLLCVISQTSPLLSQSVYVPLNHWAYDFIERLEAKGVITGALNGTKPYSRMEMANYLLQIEEKLKDGRYLSSVEYSQWEFLRFEYKEEFEQLSGSNGISYQPRLEKIKTSKIIGKLFPSFIYKNSRNFFYLRKDAFQAFFDPIFYQEWQYANPDSISGTDKVFQRTHGVTFWGSLGSHVGFFFDFRDTKEWGSRTYPNEFDITAEGLGFVNGYGTHIWHDETVAYVVFKLPYLQITLGKDFNYWGPGFNGTLSLSNHATSYDQVRLQAKFWRLKFTYLWAFLRTFPPILDSDGGTKPKNLVAHRLELNLARWLDIGLYETVIFGNRRFELAYVNPINLYRSAEHFLGDNDNVAMGFDLEFLLIPNVKLYGELFIDDLFTSRLGTGWHGNKAAFLAGGYWVDAFNIPNLDARMEYARTRPYVYSHVKDINTYSHFSTGLGHWIGPNADDLLIRMQYRFSKSLFVAFEFESFRHGANEANRNVGGDLNRPLQPGDAMFIDFLDGIGERRQSFGFEASYEIYRNFYLGVNFNTGSSKNMLLPDRTRGPVGRSEFVVNLSLNR
ncbi:MAG: capsule assembly Wzi family protein [bacterium]